MREGGREREREGGKEARCEMTYLPTYLPTLDLFSSSSHLISSYNTCSFASVCSGKKRMSVRVVYCIHLTHFQGLCLVIGSLGVHSLSSFFLSLAFISFRFLPLSFTLIRTRDERRGSGVYAESV